MLLTVTIGTGIGHHFTYQNIIFVRNLTTEAESLCLTFTHRKFTAVMTNLFPADRIQQLKMSRTADSFHRHINQ